MPTKGMVEMTGYTRHLLAETLQHRIIDYIGFLPGALSVRTVL
jgi:hypothetical protein